MIRRVAVRLIPVIAIIVGAAQLACAPRLEEAQVRARLVDQLRLSKDELRVVSIDSAAQPVATIEYAGIRAGVRFRRQDGVWVIDAVEQEGRFEPADRAVPVLARRLSEKAHARWIESVMPRYARTLKLLIGWTDLLATDCSSGLPTSQTALVNLHAVWHRVLFPNRGGEFHNMDLFLRDAWWKPFRVTLTARRVEVQSSGADGQMDTPDDAHPVGRDRLPAALHAAGRRRRGAQPTRRADRVELRGAALVAPAERDARRGPGGQISAREIRGRARVTWTRQ
jgi:hypothetical protein